MSQYPPPYSPQQPAYGGYPPQQPPQSPDELLAPARRAGITMIVLGVLAVACGLCLAATGSVIDNPELAQSPQYQQMQQQFQQVERELGITLRQFFVFMGAVPLAMGAILGALGFGVRGGRRGVAIASIVFVGILLAVLGLVILGGLVQAVATGARPEMLLGMCVYGVPFALLLMVMVWLVQAVRGAQKVEWARRQYQAQMWHYQQYQQAYLQQGQPPAQPPPGMGYGYPPPPAAPSQFQAPAPPPPPAERPTPAEPPVEKKDPPDGTSAQG